MEWWSHTHQHASDTPAPPARNAPTGSFVAAMAAHHPAAWARAHAAHHAPPQ